MFLYQWRRAVVQLLFIFLPEASKQPGEVT